MLLLSCAGQGLPETPAWADEMVASHNSVRAPLHLPPLRWSPKLAKLAQEWADTLLANGRFEHRPKTLLGENIFAIEGARALAARVVGDWASEVRDYDYSSNKCRGVCGHYTQIVWKSTRQVGCGMARNDSREVWVCNYDPPGNWVGRKPY
jgi:pathogenesis-related protein 1